MQPHPLTQLFVLFPLAPGADGPFVFGFDDVGETRGGDLVAHVVDAGEGSAVAVAGFEADGAPLADWSVGGYGAVVGFESGSVFELFDVAAGF